VFTGALNTTGAPPELDGKAHRVQLGFMGNVIFIYRRTKSCTQQISSAPFSSSLLSVVSFEFFVVAFFFLGLQLILIQSYPVDVCVHQQV